MFGECIGCGRMATLDRFTEQCAYCKLGEFEGCAECGYHPCRCRSRRSHSGAFPQVRGTSGQIPKKLRP